MNLPPETADLLEAYFAGDPTPGVIEALEAWLREDPAHPRLLAEYGLIDRLIGHEQKKQDASAIFAALLEAEESAEPIAPPVETAPTMQAPADAGQAISFKQAGSALGYLAGRSLRGKAGVLIATAAAVLLGVVLYMAFIGSGQAPTTPGTATNPPGEPPHIIVATLTAERDAVWERRPGGDLYAGQRFTLTEGFAEITTNRGAVAILKAPATIELLDNDNALRLHSGKLVGICETDSSNGFLVRTPHIDVTDVGTRFAVDVFSSDATGVYVMDGEVEVAVPEAGVVGHTLTQGQAIRGSPLEDTPIEAVQPDLKRFSGLFTAHRLTGTGIRLEAHQEDAAWQVVAIDGKALANPIALKVSPGTHSTGFLGDSQTGQWVGLYNEPREIAPPEVGHNTFTIQTQIVVPPHIDPAQTTLKLLGYFDYSIAAIRFNGQAVQGLEPPRKHDEPFHYAALLDDLSLGPGAHTVQFDVTNDPETSMGLLVQWQLITLNTTGERQR